MSSSQWPNSGGQTKIGGIVSGNFDGDARYLKCDGKEYLKASYPKFPVVGLECLGVNTTFVERTLPFSQSWAGVDGQFGGVCIALPTSGTDGALSMNGGDTFAALTIPVSVNSLTQMAYGNNKIVILNPGSSTLYIFNTLTIAWSTATVPAAVSSIAFAFGLFMLFLTYAYNQYYYSSDLSTFSLNNFGPTGTPTNTLKYGIPSYKNNSLIIPVNSFKVSGTGADQSTPYWYSSNDGFNWSNPRTTDDISSAVVTLDFTRKVEQITDQVFAISAGPSNSLRISRDGGATTGGVWPGVGGTLSVDGKLVTTSGLRMFYPTYGRALGTIFIAWQTGFANKIAASYDTCVTWSKDLYMDNLPKSTGGAPEHQHVASVIGEKKLFLPHNVIGNKISSIQIDEARFRTPVIKPKNFDGINTNFYIRAK